MPTDAKAATLAGASRRGGKPLAVARAPTRPSVPAVPSRPADGAAAHCDEATAARSNDDTAGSLSGGTALAADLRAWLAARSLTGPAAMDATQPAAAGGQPSAGWVSGTDPASAAGALPGPGAEASLPAQAGVATAEAALLAGQALDAPLLPADDARRAGPEGAARHDPAQGLLTGAGAAVPRGFDAGALAPIVLPAGLDSPGFAKALGVQVSLLASDGVQEAELHLNPAEMGPIRVRIEIDGTAAHVDFSAGTAATRDVIERGLPELASALREQGLTLAGGGVFQNPSEADDTPGREPGSRARRRASAAIDDIPRPVAVRLQQGRLDLYA